MESYLDFAFAVILPICLSDLVNRSLLSVERFLEFVRNPIGLCNDVFGLSFPLLCVLQENVFPIRLVESC